MPSYADIYASCLYAAGEGLPLWNPSPLRLGDVGYIRDGSFIVLFNAVDGPGALSDAASIHLARRSERSTSRERNRRDSNAKVSIDFDDPDDAAEAAGRSSRRSSVASSSVCSSSTAIPMSRSAASDSILPSSAKQGSPTFANLRFRPSPPPEGPYPPMPLVVDQETPKLFDMGPRMSSNYRCLGIEGGASVPGAPVGVKIGFESSGGDGAILIPRDPTERTRLKYLGVLKAYIKAHHKWMYETYGRIEAIGIDDLALIYGQDRTSDWAVAVSRDAARGAKVEFEIFGSASAGFWGNWSHTLSACQRGPHRPQAVRRDQATGPSPAGSRTRNVEHAQAPVERKRDDEDRTWGLSIGGGAVNASFSFSSPSSKDQHDEECTRGRRRSPSSRAHSVTWSEIHAPPDQTISIRRVTACTSLGLGFLPARPKAAAEPRDPDIEGKRDHDNDPVAGHNCAEHSSAATEVSDKEKHWCDDPLEALHVWIHEHGSANVKVSIASDDDCLRLLAMLKDNGLMAVGLRKAVRAAADRFARVSVDELGFATVTLGHAPLSTVTPTSVPELKPRSKSAHRSLLSTADKENTGLVKPATAKRAASTVDNASGDTVGKPHQAQGALKQRRLNYRMLPCRPISALGSLSPALVLF